MKKNIIFNIIMILLALFIIFGSIMTVYEFSNTIEKADPSQTVVKNVSGPNSLHRGGTGYSLKNNVGIKVGDRIMTGSQGTCSLSVQDKSMIHLCSNSEVIVEKATGTDFTFVPVIGTLFGEVQKGEEDHFCVKIQQASYEILEDSVFSIESLTGAQTINVYHGKVKAVFHGTETILQQGECAVLIQNEEGISNVEFKKIQTARLSEEIIEYLLIAKEDHYDDETLENVLAERAEEAEAERAAQIAREAEILAKGGTVPVYSGEGIRYADKDNLDGEDKTPLGGRTGNCTVQIRCDSILDNMDKLKEFKMEHVPENGIILDTSRVQFTEGETAFDVIKRVCDLSGISLTYEWTVQFDGYYIQGIHNLEEFDCGDKSGWMYKVNGWFPNYGCSRYDVKDGDVIVWTYTCDYGNDVGNPYE